MPFQLFTTITSEKPFREHFDFCPEKKKQKENKQNNKTYLHTLIMLSLDLKSCIIDKQKKKSWKRMINSKR